MKTYRKLDWNLVEELLGQNKTAQEIALKLNRTRSAISYVKKQLAEKKAKTVVVFQKAEETVSKFLDTWSQLKYANQCTLEVQDLVLKAIKGDQTAIDLLNKDQRYHRRDPLEMFIRVQDQLKDQLDFQAKLFKEIYSAQQMKDYQDRMDEILDQEDVCPHCKKKTNFRERVIEHAKKKFFFHPDTEWRKK